MMNSIDLSTHFILQKAHHLLLFGSSNEVRVHPPFIPRLSFQGRERERWSVLSGGHTQCGAKDYTSKLQNSLCVTFSKHLNRPSLTQLLIFVLFCLFPPPPPFPKCPDLINKLTSSLAISWPTYDLSTWCHIEKVALNSYLLRYLQATTLLVSRVKRLRTIGSHQLSAWFVCLICI